MAITRRHLLQGSAYAALAPALGMAAGVPAAGPAHAQSATGEPVWRHALSLFGDIKYPADFKRFDYVNPAAPKGGIARQILIGTFDNFNLAVAGVKGSLAAAVQLVYESLMTSSLDEVSTEYGALAEAVSHPEDFSSVTYRLRAQAKWHDGKPVTADDVIFSLDAFKKYHPQYSAYYRHVVKAEKIGDRDIKFTFDAPGNRELPLIVGQLTILPKHWWEGTDSEGRKRDISATTLEKPLGSGPYRIKEFVAGRSVALERVKDYWGRDLSANIGRNNFDELRYEYFRDSLVALEAFKGDQVDWRTENSAKNWATAYDFPAVDRKARAAGGVSKPQLRHHAGVRDESPPRQVQGSAGAPRAEFCIRFRGNEQADLLRPVQAHQQLFRRHGAGLKRSAAGQGTGNPRDGPRASSGGGFHDGLYQPGRRQSGSGARKSARGDCACSRRRVTRCATAS